MSTPTPTLVDDETIRSRLDGAQPLTWVFVGDSITHGSSHTAGRRSFVEHFAERVRTEMGRVGDVVINTGVTGDRTQDVLAGFDARVRRFGPDVVVVMLGTNDSVDGPAGRDGFRSRLGEITTRVRAAGAVPVLQTPNAVDTAASPGHADLAAYADLVRGLAATEHIVLVDHHAHWLESSDGTAPDAWLSDDIHPNATGHLEMARTLFERLGVLDPTSPTGGADGAADGGADGAAAADGAAEPLVAGEEMSGRA
ncbi:MAG TPA: SGNH/GDSL hydrolase family protein [Nocardioidaceae bacterium]|nr:SGNH/GDSL hydrolase family protein [Nocardioidaceae bacterium]